MQQDTEHGDPVAARGAQPAFDDTQLVASMSDLKAPQPRYRELIEAGHADAVAPGFVLAVSRAAVDEAFRDHTRFSSAVGGGLTLGNVRPLIPLSIDPPDHRKYRKILDPIFAPKRMDAIEASITARANHFIDAFVDRGECNFTDELAVPYPSAVFLGLMGLPWEDLDTLLRMKDGIIRPGAYEVSQEERLRIQAAAGQEAYAYFDAVLDEREVHPQSDLLSQFLETEVEGEKLTREEILDICYLFLIAGLDTVTDSLTCFYARLAQHPEDRRRIVDDPAIIPAAVEELLRWESPVPSLIRGATTDTELAGCPVHRGDFVQINVGAANVDPAEFPDPFDVRLDRAPNRHLAFGGGVHRCLGSHLARRELRVALREWHRRIPEYELKPGIELHFPIGLRSVENLELVWRR